MHQSLGEADSVSQQVFLVKFHILILILLVIPQRIPRALAGMSGVFNFLFKILLSLCSAAESNAVPTASCKQVWDVAEHRDEGK